MVDFGMPYPADLYIEGSDQYRGWFNSSLITGLAAKKKAPYKAVLTHGFVLDGQGKKMSKSMGNVVDPLKVMDQLGADILRLWVASVDYQADVRISDKMIKQVSETYRKIRNTIRFMLGTIGDFNPEKNVIKFHDMNDTDRYMLLKLDDMVEKVNAAYHAYAFDDVARLINGFVTRELSSFYLDYIKDIVYIESEDDKVRRSAQSVVYQTLSAIVRLITPILPHTAEEAYQTFVGQSEDSVYLENMPVAKYPKDDALMRHYSHFLKLRDHVLKALEDARNEKLIGKSLSAKVILYPKDDATKRHLEIMSDLARLFIVSAVEIKDGEGAYDFETLSIDIEKAEGQTCARCWQVTNINEEELCERCENVMKSDATN